MGSPRSRAGGAIAIGAARRFAQRLAPPHGFAASVCALAVMALCPAGALGNQPQVPARSWALIDARTGEMITSHAASRRLPVASTTKLMTAWVVLHELALGRIVRAAAYHAGPEESLLGLRPGERISVRDLLYGMVLVSGNDAAYDLALAAAGSERHFVRQMNRRAAALGLTDTHYANPIGLDQRGNYSSARDLTTLARHLMAIPAFARIADSRSAVLRSLRPPRRIQSINELLRMAPWINGVKTGHTSDAGYVEVGSGRRKGVELISAAIGAPSDADRFRDNLRLLDYGFSLYRRKVAVRGGQQLAHLRVRSSGAELALVGARTVKIAVRRAQRLSLRIRAPREVAGPIARGALLGRVGIYLGTWRAVTVPLRAARSIPAPGATEQRGGLIGASASGPVLIAFVIVIGVAARWRRRRAVAIERS